ncbi:hypothetical protein EYD10_08647 [Varanus komodoensis]|nr:hypothetical protein EYD10_08647 [Varanus komodoensis]
MNNVNCKSLFFISLPELRKLCAVKVTVSSQIAETGIRTAQMKMCRQLLLLHQDVLSSPVPGTLNQISVVMTINFYKSGKFQTYVEKHGATIAMPERVIPVVFQICLSYTLIAKLSPNWNQVGHLLIQGRGFLSQLGKQNAVIMEINSTETQLCISVEVCKVQLPLAELEDFNISANILKKFNSNNNVVIQGCSLLNNWCYVLPSMKMGQIISISHRIPSDSPFQSYSDLQLHWEKLYGYILPEDPQIYCSIYFKMIGEQLFTYPLYTLIIYPFSCIRSQQVQYFPRVDLEGVLNAFITDLKTVFPHICGFPLKMTNKALYATKGLTQSSLQKINSKPVNLTGNRNCKVIFRPSTCDLENNHKMELKVNWPKPDIFSNLSLLAEDENTKAEQGGVCSRKQWKTPKEPALLLNSEESFQKSKNYFKKDSTRIIPIFKGKFLQMDKQTVQTIHGNKKQNVPQYSPKVMTVNTAAELPLFTSSAHHIKKPLHNGSFKNVTNRNVLNMQVEKPRANSITFSLKRQKESLGHLPNIASTSTVVLDRNSSKIKSRRLNSSLKPACDGSMGHASTVCQHLDTPANFSTIQSTASTESKKPCLFLSHSENPRIFMNKNQSSNEEAKRNACKLSRTVCNGGKREALKEVKLVVELFLSLAAIENKFIFLIVKAQSTN